MMAELTAARESAPRTSEQALAGKDPLTRLLDLTAGWAQYVEEQEAEHPDSVTSAQIYDACGDFAAFAEPYWGSAEEVQQMAARHYFETRLLPLMHGERGS